MNLYKLQHLSVSSMVLTAFLISSSSVQASKKIIEEEGDLKKNFSSKSLSQENEINESMAIMPLQNSLKTFESFHQDVSLQLTQSVWALNKTFIERAEDDKKIKESLLNETKKGITERFDKLNIVGDNLKKQKERINGSIQFIHDWVDTQNRKNIPSELIDSLEKDINTINAFYDDLGNESNYHDGSKYSYPNDHRNAPNIGYLRDICDNIIGCVNNIAGYVYSAQDNISLRIGTIQEKADQIKKLTYSENDSSHKKSDYIKGTLVNAMTSAIDEIKEVAEFAKKRANSADNRARNIYDNPGSGLFGNSEFIKNKAQEIKNLTYSLNDSAVNKLNYLSGTLVEKMKTNINLVKENANTSYVRSNSADNRANNIKTEAGSVVNLINNVKTQISNVQNTINDLKSKITSYESTTNNQIKSDTTSVKNQSWDNAKSYGTFVTNKALTRGREKAKEVQLKAIDQAKQKVKNGINGYFNHKDLSQTVSYQSKIVPIEKELTNITNASDLIENSKSELTDVTKKVGDFIIDQNNKIDTHFDGLIKKGQSLYEEADEINQHNQKQAMIVVANNADKIKNTALTLGAYVRGIEDQRDQFSNLQEKNAKSLKDAYEKLLEGNEKGNEKYINLIKEQMIERDEKIKEKDTEVKSLLHKLDENKDVIFDLEKKLQKETQERLNLSTLNQVTSVPLDGMFKAIISILGIDSSGLENLNGMNLAQQCLIKASLYKQGQK